MGQHRGLERLRVEPVRAIDEGDRPAFPGGGAEDGIEEGEAARGVGSGADLGKRSFPEAAAQGLVQRGDARGKEKAVPGGGDGKALSQKLAQLVDGGGRLHGDPLEEG